MFWQKIKNRFIKKVTFKWLDSQTLKEARIIKDNIISVGIYLGTAFVARSPPGRIICLLQNDNSFVPTKWELRIFAMHNKYCNFPLFSFPPCFSCTSSHDTIKTQIYNISSCILSYFKHLTLKGSAVKNIYIWKEKRSNYNLIQLTGKF